MTPEPTDHNVRTVFRLAVAMRICGSYDHYELVTAEPDVPLPNDPLPPHRRLRDWALRTIADTTPQPAHYHASCEDHTPQGSMVKRRDNVTVYWDGEVEVAERSLLPKGWMFNFEYPETATRDWIQSTPLHR